MLERLNAPTTNTGGKITNNREGANLAPPGWWSREGGELPPP